MAGSRENRSDEKCLNAQDSAHNEAQNIIEISGLEQEALRPYAERSEKQLVHWYEPKPGIFVAETINVIERALQDGYEPVSFLIEKDRVKEAECLLAGHPQVPVYTAPDKVLTSITGYQLTRGVLCVLRRRELPSAAELIKGKRRIVVLEEVMNPTNVGAIFRSAAALGVEAVLLTKGSSDPLYRRAARVSMGTVFQVPWTYCDEGWGSMLKEAGFKTVAMALRDDSRSLDDPEIAGADKLAIIMGTEGDGLKNTTIEDCDYTVKIPMTNGVDSLNVAAASAVAFWALCRS